MDVVSSASSEIRTVNAPSFRVDMDRRPQKAPKPSLWERVPWLGAAYRREYDKAVAPLLVSLAPNAPLGSTLDDLTRARVSDDIRKMTRYNAWATVVQRIAGAAHDAVRSTLWWTLAPALVLGWSSRAGTPLRWAAVAAAVLVWGCWRAHRMRGTFAVALAIWLVLAAALAAQPAAGETVAGRAGAVVLAVIMAGIAVQVMARALTMPSGRRSYGGILVVLGVGIAGVLMLDGVGARAGAWAGLVLAGALAAVAIVHDLVQTAVGAWKNGRDPEAEVVQTMVWLAREVETRSEHERDVVLRRRTAQDVEYIAARLVWDVPRRLRSGDPATDAWMSQALQRRAHSLRQLKCGLFLGVPNSYAEVLRSIVASLQPAAARDWLALDAVQPPNPPRPRGFEAALSIGRSVLIPLVPLAGVVGMRTLGLAPDDPWLDKLTPLAAAWPVLAFVNWVNPRSERSGFGAGASLPDTPKL